MGGERREGGGGGWVGGGGGGGGGGGYRESDKIHGEVQAEAGGACEENDTEPSARKSKCIPRGTQAVCAQHRDWGGRSV